MKLREFLQVDKIEIQSPWVVSAQYIANFKDTDHLDDIIVKWTSPFNKGARPHSHSEIGFYVNQRWCFFSSTPREFLTEKGKKTTGTRWISSESLLKHPERWDLYAKSFPNEGILKMIERADSVVDLPYDWCGIASFGSPFDLTNLRLRLRGFFSSFWRTHREGYLLPSWYCSRVCEYVETGRVRRVSPQRRYLYLLYNDWTPIQGIQPSGEIVVPIRQVSSSSPSLV